LSVFRIKRKNGRLKGCRKNRLAAEVGIAVFQADPEIVARIALWVNELELCLDSENIVACAADENRHFFRGIKRALPALFGTQQSQNALDGRRNDARFGILGEDRETEHQNQHANDRESEQRLSHFFLL